MWSWFRNAAVLWEISAIQTIKIGSESREGGETTDCEGGTYFTHWVVICQAFAPNYPYSADLISSVLCNDNWWWGNWVAHLFTAFQGQGRALAWAAWAGTATIRSRAEVSQPTSCFLKVRARPVETLGETFVTCHTMSRRRHRGCWQEAGSCHRCDDETLTMYEGDGKLGDPSYNVPLAEWSW